VELVEAGVGVGLQRRDDAVDVTSFASGATEAKPSPTAAASEIAFGPKPETITSTGSPGRV